LPKGRFFGFGLVGFERKGILGHPRIAWLNHLRKEKKEKSTVAKLERNLGNACVFAVLMLGRERNCRKKTKDFGLKTGNPFDAP
jgi:hypothetical protein